ncbi:MAG: UbiA family prenyltransferase [Candidatus Micrarchaeota archaeon]|nr:UbiA family prenyltransferase [Candidatus Micrarchaeota archaeon]
MGKTIEKPKMPDRPAPAPGAGAHAQTHGRVPAHSASSTLQAWLRLVRIEHALMSAAGVFIGLLLASGSGPALLAQPLRTLLLSLSVPVLINIGAFALNDYWDIETDRLNGRVERPLVSGALSPTLAIETAGAGLLFGILAAAMLNPAASAVAALFAVLSLAYDRWLKDLPLLGNLTIAASMAIAFAFGGLALGMPIEKMPPSLTLLTVGAFLAGLGRELVKTVQDMEGDRLARKSRSLPLLIGPRPCLLLAALCYAAFAFTAVLLLSSGPAFTVISGGLLMLAALAFLTQAAQLLLQPPAPALLEQLRKSSLWSLFIALIGIAIAAL